MLRAVTRMLSRVIVRMLRAVVWMLKVCGRGYIAGAGRRIAGCESGGPARGQDGGRPPHGHEIRGAGTHRYLSRALRGHQALTDTFSYWRIQNPPDLSTPADIVLAALASSAPCFGRHVLSRLFHECAAACGGMWRVACAVTEACGMWCHRGPRGVAAEMHKASEERRPAVSLASAARGRPADPVVVHANNASVARGVADNDRLGHAVPAKKLGKIEFSIGEFSLNKVLTVDSTVSVSSPSSR
eukprot:8964819-Pyramimonas_sp.AAC.1